MVLVEFSIFPTDKGESVSSYVAQVIDLIDRSGVDYQLTPMGTILEGDWESVNKVVSDCVKLLEGQSNRIYMSLKMDYRKGSGSRLKSKVEKVARLMGRQPRIAGQD